MQRRPLGLLVVCALLIAGCSATSVTVKRPTSPPLVQQVTTGPSDARPGFRSVPGESTLTLAQALELALLNNPELKAFSLEVRAREARALQASLLPNPEVDLEVENVGGQAAARGTRAAESTIFLSQLIELGGKRSKRTRVATLGGEVAGWEYETRKLQVFTEVVQAYVDVLTAQERLKLQRELVDLSSKFLQTIRKRVEAGRTSPAEAYRAGVDLDFLRVQLEKARQELKSARKRLAALWGAEQARFGQVEGNLEELKPFPPLRVLENLLDQNPELARRAAEIVHQEAVLAVERAARIPDPSVGLGYRQLNEEADRAFVASLSVPLPVFDRNQGGIQEARVRVEQARWYAKAARVSLRTHLVETYNALVATAREVEALKKRILPNAQRAYEVIRSGYKMGKFGYLEVLDAQRTLFEVQSRYLDALARYHKRVAELEQLVGQDLAEVGKSK